MQMMRIPHFHYEVQNKGFNKFLQNPNDKASCAKTVYF